MRSSTRVLMTAWSSLIAVLLIFAGFLLGVDPQIGGAVSSRSIFQPSGDYALQREVLQKLEGTYYKEIDLAAVEKGAIDGMLAALGDPYTTYLDPEEYQEWTEATSGSYSGVGMTVHMRDHLVTVVSVFEDSPAALAGIQAGDVVVAVDGLATDGETLDEVVGRMKGPEGTSVMLKMWRPPLVATSTTSMSETGEAVGEETTTTTTVEEGDPTVDLTELPANGETQEYAVTRRVITVPVTDSKILTVDGKDVALISLYSFTENAPAELRAEVEAAVDQDKVAAIILDLRGNGGGRLDAAVEVAGIFIDTGVIVSTKGLHSAEEVYKASGAAFTDVPLYVLTDGDTASASEIVSGALQDYHRATLVGETTFGKGLVQSLIKLSDDEGALKVTIAVYLTPKGRDINATGISPDVVAPDDPQTPDEDECVETALDLIAGSSPGR